MAIVGYTPQLKVEWYRPQPDQKEVLRDLKRLKPEILDAVLWLGRKKRRRGHMVTLWLDSENSELAVEIYGMQNLNIFAKLIDYAVDNEVGQIHLPPLID